MAAEMFVLFVLMYPTNNFVIILFNNRLKNKSTQQQKVFTRSLKITST